MKIKAIGILAYSCCFCAAGSNLETIPAIPQKVTAHKSIAEVIPEESIIRLISLMPVDAAAHEFDTTVALTSNHYRFRADQVMPMLFKSDKAYVDAHDGLNDALTNDILIITKDKIWRVQVRECSNIGAMPLLCLITDGQSRYNYMLPFPKSKERESGPRE